MASPMLGGMKSLLVLMCLLHVIGCCLSSADQSGPPKKPCDDDKREAKGEAKGEDRAAPVCPPPGFDSVANFDLRKYISARWYVLYQMPLTYQPVESLYCVTARYQPLDPQNLEAGLQVNNFANMGGVNGPAMGTGEGRFQLTAVPAFSNSTSPTAASKLLVGPSFLRNTIPNEGWRALYGPYWVVATGKSVRKTVAGYDWAIVSGGPPNTPTMSGCRTGSAAANFSSETNGIGLWYFSRSPFNPRAVNKMNRVAKALGYDLSVLLPVEHKGCTYEGAQ